LKWQGVVGNLLDVLDVLHWLDDGLHWEALHLVVLHWLDDRLDWDDLLDGDLLLDFWLRVVDDLALNRGVLDTLHNSLLRDVLDVSVVEDLRNVLGLILDCVVLNHLLLARNVLSSLDCLVFDDGFLVWDVLNAALTLDRLMGLGLNLSGSDVLRAGDPWLLGSSVLVAWLVGEGGGLDLLEVSWLVGGGLVLGHFICSCSGLATNKKG